MMLKREVVMQVKSNGRVRRTESGWRELITRWQGSGQGVVEFCRAQEIQLTSFQRWRQRLAQASAASDFVAVTSAPTAPEPVVATWSLELTLPNGCTLRFRG